ncbi:MAG: DUF998 domain-containing protein [Limosilactobacillus sp.]|uniref:DUF998 domain-containing protein n=1 Tax=Limosilactobacillus sp. TaxID=2773925 RepID=UPI0027095A59|nr:DUF998 domain-containing protein [Limosilactobacillus sp.]
MANKYKIEIPASALKEAGIEEDEELVLNLTHKQFTIRPTNAIEQLPQIHILSYIIPAILTTVMFMIYWKHQSITQVALNGRNNSIANASTLLGTVCGLLIFLIAAIWTKTHRTGPIKDMYWRNIPTIVISTGMILVFSFYAAFWLLGEMFKDASFDIYTSSVMIFMVVSAVNYIMINLAMTLTTNVITNLLTIMIIGGMLFSILTNSSRDWWRHNFSFLGTAKNTASFQFNITLIFSGILMATLVDYLFVNLHKRYRRKRVLALRILLYGLSACVAAIGIFPNDPQYHVLHDRISMWLVYIILILIGAVKWILPRVTKQFLTISYTIGVVMGLEYIVFKLTSYLSLTAFELLEFGLAFGWILLLFQNIENLSNYGQNLFIVKVEEE